MTTLKQQRKLHGLYRDERPYTFEDFLDRFHTDVEPTGMVYFLQGGKYVKIGYTEQNVMERIRALQTGNPFPLRLLALTPGTTWLEKDLHRVFSLWRMEGEWFRMSAPGMREVIRSIKVGKYANV